MNEHFISIKPAFPNCDHCIVFCADNNFIPLTAVAIQSIVENSRDDEWYDIIILHESVDPAHERTFAECWTGRKNLCIRFCNVAPFFEGLRLFTENRETITREAYFRIIIPWILDPVYEKALYLDGDMILRHDVKPVFNRELGHNLIAAVRDYWGICNCYIHGDPLKEYRLSIGLDDIDNYIISATLLFNLAEWRAEHDLEKVLKLCVSKNWDQHDQDVINVLCKGRITLLPPSWGMMEDYGNNHYLPIYLLEELNACEADPVIAHYGGSHKPYARNYCEHDLEFWRYASQTQYIANLFERIRSMEYRNYVALNIAPEIYIPGCKTVSFFGVPIDEPYLGERAYSVIRLTKDGSLAIEGSVSFFKPLDGASVTLCLLVNGSSIALDETDVGEHNRESLAIPRYRCTFSATIPLSAGTTERITLVASVGAGVFQLKDISFHRFSPISGQFISDYYTEHGWTVKANPSEGLLIVTRNTPGTILRDELSFLREAWGFHADAGKKSIMLRTLAHLTRPFFRKPIWLVSDRCNKADDNGEVFFRYLRKEHRKDVHAFFLLSKTAPEYAALSRLGGVVEPYSWRHKLLVLIAQWSISSQTDIVFRDPFWDYGSLYRNMLRKTKFVFLQHGVISNDLSRWLNRDTQQIDGFVTSTERETKGILEGSYGYTADQVWMTGLPRFDRLVDERKRVITVMPTWRKYLAIGQNHETGEWNVSPGFGDSKYVTFYRDLMNNQRLKEAARYLGYVVQIKIHPTFIHKRASFEFDDDVQIVGADMSYAKLYGESSLIVTDYSSSIYDFVYLEKPVIYCQFDAEEFFSGRHIYDKGDFDYERDGFGEITRTIDETVELLIKYMHEGCPVHEPYRTRMRNTFPSREPKHCEMLYQRIVGKSEF